MLLLIAGLGLLLYGLQRYRFGSSAEQIMHLAVVYSSPVIAVLLHLTFYLLYFEPYKRQFKSAVMGPLAGAMNASLRVQPDAFIPKATFDRGYLQNIATIVSDYRGGHLVTGGIGKIPVQFCELRVNFRLQRERIACPVNMLFFQARLSQPFDHHIYIAFGRHPDPVGRVLASKKEDLAAAELSMQLEMTAMDGVEPLIVFSNNKAKAEKLLKNDGIAQKLIRLANSRCFTLFCSDHDIFMSFVISDEWLKPYAFESAISVKRLGKHLSDFYANLLTFIELGAALTAQPVEQQVG
jgi:hypothetical protein